MDLDSSMIERRRALQLLGGAGLAVLVGCGSDSKTSSASSSTTTSSSSSLSTASSATGTTLAAADCVEIPIETAGPYPGDGSNGPNVLTQNGVVRSDITSSFGSSSTVAPGVPLTIKLNILDAGSGCAVLPGAAVYLWHCTRDGKYSMYSQGVTNENFLRGVQEVDANGTVTFKSIFPGAYSGRWPHMHFEVYPSLSAATSAGTKIATSQLALPEDICNTVYATYGYSASIQNLAQTSLTRDMVFSDSYQQQLATMSGDVTSGLVASLTVPV